MSDKRTSFTELKTTAASKGLELQFIDRDDNYFIFLVDGGLTLTTILSKTESGDAADVTDFETNFKPTGNDLIDTKKIIGDTDNTTIGNCEDGLKVAIQGNDGAHCADVFLSGGIKQLQTNATVTVESLLGEAVFPFTYIEINDEGDIGDTLRTQIPDDSVDVTTTRAGTQTDNDFAKAHRDDLNADSNFNVLYDAITPRNSHLICIEAKLIQTIRPDSNDVTIETTGTLVATLGFDKILDHPLALALFPHPQDCRKGTVNVTGTIGVIETGRPPKRLLLWGDSPYSGQEGDNEDQERADQSIDRGGDKGFWRLSNNPEFDTSRDFLVTELRIETAASSIIIGADDKYIEVSKLENDGHEFQLRSDGNLEYDEVLRTVNDIHHAFVFGVGSKFDLQMSGSGTSLVAVFARPFFLRRAGTFGTDDDIIVSHDEDLSTSSLKRLQVSVVGFFED